jgi:hypothetical protein
MATYRLYPSSLDPPALSADDVAAAEENLPLVLLVALMMMMMMIRILFTSQLKGSVWMPMHGWLLLI